MVRLSLVLALLGSGVLNAAPRERLDLRHVRLELPAAPAAFVPADVDGDGLEDLVVAVAYTEWDQISIEERAEMDGVDGLVEILTIVPSLVDRRELLIFRGRPGGTYEAIPPLALEPSVLSLTAGPASEPVVALIDDGLAGLRWNGDGATPPSLEPLLTSRPILARSRTFLPDLELIHDLDNDGDGDVLFPTAEGLEIYTSDAGGIAAEPIARLTYPSDPRSRPTRRRYFPLPQVRDVNGDGLPDLLLPHHRDLWEHFHLFVNAGGGRFETPRAPLGPPRPDGLAPVPSYWEEEDDHEEDGAYVRVVHFGDLDGDGVGEYLTEEDVGDLDAGWRKEIKEAKRPPYRYRVHGQEGDGYAMATEPRLEFEATGYAFHEGGDNDGELRIPGGLQDLDGDGRQDLITLTLDFSLMQAIRILATKSLNIGLDFHIWCQTADGRFRAVSGLDLSGRFKLRLDNLRIGQLSQFAGDFDGDGRADFVQMGRGERVTIHRGGDACRYPAEPDLTLELEEAPKDLALVRVEDLDGDGLTDLLIIHPGKPGEPGVSAPVSLDLYLSGGQD